MDILYRLGEAGAAEVVEHLPDRPAYNSVRVTLGILERKGMVRHRQDGNRYVYAPTVPPEKARDRPCGTLFARFPWLPLQSDPHPPRLAVDPAHGRGVERAGRQAGGSQAGEELMSAFDLLQLDGRDPRQGRDPRARGVRRGAPPRRRSAASRYAVWSAAFLGLVLLPVLTLSLPVLDPPSLVPAPIAPSGAAVPRPTLGRVASVRRAPDVLPVGRRRACQHEAHHRGQPTRRHARPHVRRRGGAAWRAAARAAAPWLLVAWLSGALAVLGMLVRDIRRIARVTRRAAILRRGPLHELGCQVAMELGIRGPVRLALTRELAMPVSWGLWHPIVLLPADARRWEPERRRVVLRHELAHVRRRDYAGHLLIELACALHWVNPLVWRAAHRARLEQEQACDDRVLGLGTKSVEYAQHLLDIARTFASPSVPVRGALAMAAAATLPERMQAMLDVGLDHRPAGRRTLLGVAAAAVVFALPTAALRPWSEARREAQLTVQLTSASAEARRDAAWSLGALGSRHARRALTAALRDTDPGARGVAAWALGKLGDRAAVPALVGALHDPDAHVREIAVLALGDLGDRRAVAALAPLAR